MEVDYQKIIEYVLESGKRLVSRAGNIEDIGVKKQYFTEEDLKIERGFKDIIQSFGEKHVLYAEEENDVFQNSEDLWVSDPISGTQSFIQGLPHYTIVISHVKNHKTVFACIYDPTVDELFTAWLGKGAFLNNQKIMVSDFDTDVVFRGSSHFEDKKLVDNLFKELESFKMEQNLYSYAYNYCSVACGRVDGIIMLTKDSFPEFAGSLLIREAGGMFTNVRGEVDLEDSDRIFIGGNQKIYPKLMNIIEKSVS